MDVLLTFLLFFCFACSFFALTLLPFLLSISRVGPIAGSCLNGGFYGSHDKNEKSNNLQ